MKIGVLGSAGGMSPARLLTSFRIGENMILDAGSVAQALPIEEQAKIHDILLTHAHLDHSGTLPFFVDNIFGMRSEPFVVHSIKEAIASVKEHLFNDDIWPDFSALPDLKRAQMRFAELSYDSPVDIGGYKVTAIRVNHTIPSIGFVIEDESSAVVFSGDTAATDRLWEVASANPKLKAAFIETSFPNAMQDIADVSGHLTPQTLRDELPKLTRDVPIFIYHIKPRFYDEVVAELKELREREIHILEQGRDYEFP